jgi:hypothetical protein
MRVGRDDHEPRAGEACGIDNLAIEDIFRRVQKRFGEEEAHRHIARVFGLQVVEAEAGCPSQMFPVVRVLQFSGDLERFSVCVFLAHLRVSSPLSDFEIRFWSRTGREE